MGATILTAFVIILALRRGTKNINQQAQEMLNDPQSRSDTEKLSQQEKAEGEPQLISCPSCGAEISSCSSICAFCGRAI